MISVIQHTWQEVCDDNDQTFGSQRETKGEEGGQDPPPTFQQKEAGVRDNLFESQLCWDTWNDCYRQHQNSPV